jgi:ABC-type transport system substrate-binding protein
MEQSERRLAQKIVSKQKFRIMSSAQPMEALLSPVFKGGTTMFKRKALYLIIVALVLSSILVAACGSPTPTEAPTQAPAQPTNTANPAPTTAPATPMPTPMPTPETGPAYGGTLIVSYEKDLTSLDTPSAWSTMDWGTAAQLLYNGLYVFDKEMKLVPDLASEMSTVSDDGLLYTIPLKKGVKFHNGREMTAADVKYSMERNAKPDSGTWAASVPLGNVLGGQAVVDGEADEAEGIKVIDDYTLEFHLLEPDIYFINSLTMVTNYVVAREEVERWGEDYAFHPVGTGPFMMTDWIPGEKVIFERNPHYYVEGLPYLDGIVYELGADPSVSLLRFERGEVDVLADGIPVGDIDRLATDAKWSEYFVNAPTFLWNYMAFQLENPPFDDPKVRQALAMSIDKEKLIQLQAGLSLETNRLYPDIFACHSTGEEFGDPFPYDPERAKALLAEAGYPDGFEVEAWFPVGRPWTARVGESLQQDLVAVGLDVELLQLENAVGTEMIKNGEISLWQSAWGASFPDPFNHVTELFATAAIGGGNRFNYSNPKVDALIADAISTSDPEERCETWKEIERILFQEDMPVVPLFHLGWPAMRSPRVENFIWHPMYKRPWYEHLWIPTDEQ